MSYKPTSIDREGDKSTFMYHNIDLQEFPGRVEKFFREEGYKRESGHPDSGIYVRENEAMKLLLGSLAKRFVFEVKLECSGKSCRLDLIPRGTSGNMSNYTRIKEETFRLVEKIKRTEL